MGVGGGSGGGACTSMLGTTVTRSPLITCDWRNSPLATVPPYSLSPEAQVMLCGLRTPALLASDS